MMNKENLSKLSEIVAKVKDDFAETYNVGVDDICLYVSPSGYLHLYTESKESDYADHFSRWIPGGD